MSPTRPSGSESRAIYWQRCIFNVMGEQQEVMADLRAAGVLAGIRWAYESATRRSLEMYCEADGHDPAWLGHTRFTLFRDRLDRVFSCVRYAVPAVDGGLGRD